MVSISKCLLWLIWTFKCWRWENSLGIPSVLLSPLSCLPFKDVSPLPLAGRELEEFTFFFLIHFSNSNYVCHLVINSCHCNNLIQMPGSSAWQLGSQASRLLGVGHHFCPELHCPRALIQTLVFARVAMKSDPSGRGSNIHMKEKGSCLEENDP